MRGYAEMLLDRSKPLEPALEREMLERVLAETLRIHRIVKQLLAYSREPREKEPTSPTDVKAVASAAAALVQAQGRYRDVKIDVDVPAEIPPVLATEGALVQVLLNLALNAAEATGSDGRLSITARRAGERVVISVTDDGPGVPAELRAQIFDPFYTTKEPGEGTGLGLSVSQSIVEGLGGTLRLAESARGARFEIELAAVA